MTLDPTTTSPTPPPDWVPLEELRARADRQSAARRTGPTEVWFPAAVLTISGGGMTTLWLNSSTSPEATAAGNWCSAGMLALLALWVLARSIRSR